MRIWIIEDLLWLEFRPDLPSIFKQYFFETIDGILHRLECHFINQDLIDWDEEFRIWFKYIKHE